MTTASSSFNPASPGIQPAPASAPTHAHAVTAKRTQRAASHRRILPYVLAAAGLAVAVWLGRLGVHAWYYETTDNAYVTGHLLQISAQIDGPVQEVRVQDNQKVKQGDVLVALDPAEFAIACQKAEAGLTQARAQENQTVAASAQADAQLAEANARVVQAEAQAGQARAQLDLARLTLARAEKLFANGGAVTQADVDNARTAYEAAAATVDAAGANRTAAQAAVLSSQAAQKAALAQTAAAQASVGVAAAALRDAERKLGYSTISAPAGGRVGNKNVEVGNRVLAGQTLLNLAEDDPWIVANFKETQLARMQRGQSVEVTVDALPGTVLHGRIDSFSPASGADFALLPPDNATGNFNKVVQRIPVKIALDAESLRECGDRLRLGYSVIVDVRVR